MKNFERVNDHIYSLRIPYMDIFTTVYLVRTESGMLLFDTASYDQDVEEYIVPALRELGVGEKELKYVFVSHDHTDHSGGLGRLLEVYPKVCVASGSEAIGEKFKEYTVLSPMEGEILLGCLRVVYVIGHTKDSMALYDTRTKTLISGDCLQLYGIFGSGAWGANIPFFKEYEKDIQKLREMDIEAVVTAHDYHPCGRMYFGREEIALALDSCLEPFEIIKGLIEDDPDGDDKTICDRYNSRGDRPRLGSRVVKRYREYIHGLDLIVSK